MVMRCRSPQPGQQHYAKSQDGYRYPELAVCQDCSEQTTSSMSERNHLTAWPATPNCTVPLYLIIRERHRCQIADAGLGYRSGGPSYESACRRSNHEGEVRP